MGSENIDVKEQWDVVQTIAESSDLEHRIIRFMEHTLKTLSQPRHIMTPFGEAVATDEVEHPLGDALGRIRAVREGCFKQYGKMQWEQGDLFSQFETGTDG